MHERAKRTAVVGWSKEAVRRHTKWLYSVKADDLDGQGIAATLTLRDCPEDSAAFHALRRAWIRRVERMGATRIHWVIEWQRRGVPHMHIAVYSDPHRSTYSRTAFGESSRTAELPRGINAGDLIKHWIAVAEPYGVDAAAQDVKAITGAVGWLQYLSKHAARGAAHYQRSGKPAGWEKTGRLWGHIGAWPVEEPLKFQVPQEAFFRYRRLVRSWRLADARSESDPVTRARRISSARGMLRCNDRPLSEVRGISEWIAQDQLISFLGLLASDGYDVRQIADE
jgi:hypothetical protein